MSQEDKSKPVAKLVKMLEHKDKAKCDCGGSCCTKKAAISTLGNIGSRMHSLKPSVIRPNDLSSKPTPKRQLGDKGDNVFLNNYQMQRPASVGNVNFAPPQLT